MKRTTFLSLLCAFLAFAATEFGPAVGTRFAAANPPVGPKGAAILLHASNAQSAELEQHRAAFQKLGIEVATLGGERSGWLLLDGKRTVVAKYFEDDSSQCLTSAAVLVHQFGWTPPVPAREVQGKQLTAALAASNSTVAPGERIALIVDVDLQPGMHVYAPGVENYIPIDWKMEDAAAASVHGPVFPKSEKLYLKAIDETVPAFRNRFRLTRDITIKSPAVSGHFALDGALRYQACDDRVCYIPQTLRLQWTFDYREPGVLEPR